MSTKTYAEGVKDGSDGVEARSADLDYKKGYDKGKKAVSKEKPRKKFGERSIQAKIAVIVAIVIFLLAAVFISWKTIHMLNRQRREQQAFEFYQQVNSSDSEQE